MLLGCGGLSNTLFNCQLRPLAPPVAYMNVVDWLERRGYVANYPGEWIALSGRATAEAAPSGHKLEFHGEKQEDAMEVIQLMWTATPELWTLAIKVPYKPRTQESSNQI